MISWMYSNFGKIGRHTIELPTLEHPKYPHIVVQWGKMVSTVFLVVYLLENYSKYF